MIKLLVSSGANPNARNNYALMSAQRDNNQDLIKFFLDGNYIDEQLKINILYSCDAVGYNDLS